MKVTSRDLSTAATCPGGRVWPSCWAMLCALVASEAAVAISSSADRECERRMAETVLRKIQRRNLVRVALTRSVRHTSLRARTSRGCEATTPFEHLPSTGTEADDVSTKGLRGRFQRSSHENTNNSKRA